METVNMNLPGLSAIVASSFILGVLSCWLKLCLQLNNKKRGKTFRHLKDKLTFYRAILNDLPTESNSFQVIKGKVQKIDCKLIKMSQIIK